MNAGVRGVLLLGAIALIVPWFLSRKHRVVRRALIRARPADIFPLINNLRDWPRWTAWSEQEGLAFTYEGAASGVGAVQRWKSCGMDGLLRIVQSVPDQRVAYDLAMSGGKYRMEGIISLEPAGEFTQVTWISKWDGGRNPYAGYMNLYCKRRIGSDFATGLNNLRKVAEQAQS